MFCCLYPAPEALLYTLITMSNNRKPVWKRVMKYLAFIVVIAAAVIGLNLFFTSREVPTYESPLRSVTTTRAEQRDITQSITLSGYVMSDSMVPVVPFVSGTIEEYDVKAGDVVSEGQVLAVIDKRPYELQLTQAQAALDAYESSYERLVKLNGIGAASDQDLETVRAQMQASQAQLELAQLQLSYTDVTASIDGTVIMADQSVGSIGNSQTPVAIIADTDHLSLSIAVPERWYSLLAGNEELSVTVTSKVTGAKSTASVVSIAPYIDPTTKSFTLKVSIDDPAPFTVGMYADVEIVYATVEDVWALSEDVLKADGSLYYVEGDTAHYIAPQDWTISDGWFIAPAGYEDATFIIDGQNSVLDGERVTVKEN